jgi:leucyl-tRNA synthetase
MFTGDYKLGGDWSDEGITGIDRFINRAWRLVTRYSDGVLPVDEPKASDYSDDLFRVFHNTIKSVGDDLTAFSFNTAISRMMELVNGMYRWVGEEGSDLDQKVDRKAAKCIVASLVKLMAPVAPHFAEEAWKRFGSTDSVFTQSWPVYNEEAMVLKTVTLILQVNGKIRDKIEAPADADKKSLEEMALNSTKIQNFMDGKTLRKVIVVPGKLVNIVVS